MEKAARFFAHTRRAVPGDSGEPPRAKGGLTTQAREERVVHFACALTFAGMYSLNPSFFSPARLADKRPSRPASCQSPPPKAVPALGIHPSSGTTSFLFGKLRSMGHNAVSFQDYRGQFRVRKPRSHKIRSTPKIRSFSSDFHQQRCSEQVLGPSLTARCVPLASTKSKRRTRIASLLGVERASNKTEPLNMVMALLIQRAKGEMELVPSAVGPDDMEQRCSCAAVRTLRVDSQGGKGLGRR